MRQKKEEMPIAIEAPGVTLRSVGGQGGMAISHYVATEPADGGPVLKSLPNGNCSVLHWGYVPDIVTMDLLRDLADRKGR